MDAGEKGREKMEEEMREVQKEVEDAEEQVAGRANGAYQMVDLEEGRLIDTPSVSTPNRSNTSSPINGASTASRPLGGGARSKRSKSISALSKEDALTSLKEGAKNLAHLFFSPIFIQAFVLTFLAEWGDRSQITTIALAAAHVSVILLLLLVSIDH